MFVFYFIISITIAKSVFCKETFYCNDLPDNSVKRGPTPWLVLFLVIGCPNENPEIVENKRSAPFLNCSSFKNVAFSDYVPILEYKSQILDYYPPICLGTILTENLVLTTRTCMKKVKSIFSAYSKSDPFLMVMTVTDSNNYRPWTEEKLYESDNTDLAILSFTSLFVFNENVHKITLPNGSFKDSKNSKINWQNEFEYPNCKDKQCRAYGWDSDVQICGSYQIIQNQNILPRYSSKPKDGWYADIQSRFVDSERSMPYYYALGEIGSPLICQFDLKMTSKRYFYKYETVQVLMGIATNVKYHPSIKRYPYYWKQFSGFISIHKHYEWIEKIINENQLERSNFQGQIKYSGAIIVFAFSATIF